LEWMYKGVRGLVDNEDYLTGRKVDKTFEIITAEESGQPKGDLEGFESAVPQSVFDSLPNTSNNSMVTIDLAAKLREDPLYEIRVKQREERRKLLDNPLKLKKLRTILESTITRDKHKKNKKKHKRRDSSSSGSDSSDHSDRKYDHKRHRRDDRDYERRDRDHRSSHHSHYKPSDRHKSYESNRDKERRDGNNDKRDSERRRDQRVHTNERRDDSKRYDKPLDGRQRNTWTAQSKPPQKTRLSAEQLEQKRKEMEENAVWRESQRKTNVQTYEKEEKEENQLNASGKSAQFIKPLLKSATESDSLEDRIRQKRFTSQRGYNLMDSNFARK